VVIKGQGHDIRIKRIIETKNIKLLIRIRKIKAKSTNQQKNTKVKRKNRGNTKTIRTTN
jgi:hypothetical protein